MAITLTKKKTVVTAKPAFETSTPQEIVELIEDIGGLQDEAVEISSQIKALQARLKPYADKTKALQEMITNFALAKEIGPDAEFSEYAEDYTLQVGKQGSERKVVDVELAMKRMGKKVFFEKVTLGLGICDQYLTPEEKVGVVDTKRTLRSIKVVRKVVAGQKAA